MQPWQGGGKFVGGVRKKTKESSGMPSGKFCMVIAFSSPLVPRVCSQPLGHGHPRKEQVVGRMNASPHISRYNNLIMDQSTGRYILIGQWDDS